MKHKIDRFIFLVFLFMIAIMIMWWAGALHGAQLPPLPPIPKTPTVIHSPKQAQLDLLAGKAMIAGTGQVMPVTNGLSAYFPPSNIAALRAGFSAGPTTNGPWTIFFLTNYPTNGGTVFVNVSSTNPGQFFKAVTHFYHTNGG